MVNLILKKIFNKILIFLHAKKDFCKLKKKKFLILDEVGSEKIIDLLLSDQKEDINIMEDRGKKINILALIFSIKYIFKFNKFAYKYSFIKSSGAKIALTFIDTNHHYAKIFENLSNCKLIFIQNGRGASYRYDHVKKNSFKCDYYFVNSNSYIHYSSKYISSNYISIGSIIANSFIKKRITKVNKIQWISQFKTNPFVFPSRTYQFKDTVLLPSKYYLSIISSYCKKHNLLLEIIGLSDSILEKKFYKLIVPEAKFRPKSTNYKSSYLKLSSSAIVAGMDSQLVYESFALGFRTAILSRNKFVNDISWAFGWPKKIPNQGAFYTNDPSVLRVNRILDNLRKISQSKIVYYNDTFKDIMDYDFHNKIFKKFIGNLQ